MIKLVYCITKKADLTDEEFFHYWENIHGPIGACCSLPPTIANPCRGSRSVIGQTISHYRVLRKRGGTGVRVCCPR